MTITLDDDKAKELLKEVVIELMHSQREVFYEIVLEALEDVGLANAISEGRNNDFVSEEAIFSILDDVQ
jgi:hypothetical protein